MENQPAKPTIRLKPAGAGLKPPSVPGSNQTIKLRPAGAPVPPPPSSSSSTIRMAAPAPAPIPPPMPADTNTARVPLMQGLGGAAPVNVTNMMPGAAPAYSDTTTGHIGQVVTPPEMMMTETSTSVVPKMVAPPPPPMQQGGATINLKAVPPGAQMPPPGVSPSQATINLKAPGAPAQEAPGVSASAQTINLNAPASGGAAPRKTLQLKKPGSASAPTIKLQANAPATPSASESDTSRDDSMPVSDDVVPFTRFDAKNLKVLDDGKTGGMPHAIIASIAFIALAFIAYAFIAQYVNLYTYGGVTQDQTGKFEIDKKQFVFPVERPVNEYFGVPGFYPIKDVRDGKADK